MASVYSVTTENEEAVGAATVETLVQLIGHASVKAKVCEWGVSFDGVTANNNPVRIRVLRQTTAGTRSSAVEVNWDPDNPTANCLSFNTFSAEPTASDVLCEMQCHPQAGVMVQYPLGREITLDNSTTSRLGIDVLAPEAVNCSAYMVWEE